MISALSLQPTAGGWACLSIVVVFPILLVITLALEPRRQAKARKAFLNGRDPMANEEFVQLMGDASEYTPFYFAARRIMAELSGVDSRMIRPWDTVYALYSLQWAGSLSDFFLTLEREMGKFQESGYYFDKNRMFGDWLKDLAVTWQPKSDAAFARRTD